MPQDDAWRASGFGTAGIVRQRPDGRFASALFGISMIDHGVSMMYGKADTTLADLAARAVEVYTLPDPSGPTPAIADDNSTRRPRPSPSSWTAVRWASFRSPTF